MDHQDNMDLRLLAERMKTLQLDKEQIEAQLAKVNVELDEIRQRRIPTMMQDLGVQNITLSGIGRIQLAADVFASTKEGKKTEAMLWLRDSGYDGAISETYNMSTVKAIFRRMILDGTPLPEEIFNITPYVRASIVKVA